VKAFSYLSIPRRDRIPGIVYQDAGYLKSKKNLAEAQRRDLDLPEVITFTLSTMLFSVYE